MRYSLEKQVQKIFFSQKETITISQFFGPDIWSKLLIGSRGNQQPRRHLEVPGCRWGSTRGHKPQAGKVITGEKDDDDDEEDEQADEMFLMALMFAFNLHTDICIHIAKIDRMHIKKWILVYKMQMDFSVQNANGF